LYRQQLARELHLIDALFFALVWPFRNKSSGCYSVHDPSGYGAIKDVQVQLSKVIQSVLQEHEENQLYIAGLCFGHECLKPC
jgi:hypothetical protein